MRTLHVDVGHSRYPITIGPGLLRDRGLFDAQLAGRDVLIVSNTTVAPLYLETLRASLVDPSDARRGDARRSGARRGGARRIAECILPDGEQYKTLATVGVVFDALVTHQLNRDAVVIALGGGVVGDIAGFAAACYQRGVGFVQVPTTLLAQVDSSVGGKTGVNHPGGKNLIGAFHQPLAVMTDTETLATLPDREFRAGLAEVIKYGCACDPEFFRWLSLHMADLLAREPKALTDAIARSCEIKAQIVAQDERENGLRAILNFGHTFGHAIEAATSYTTYLHGEAVALGMLIASDFSSRLGMIDGDVDAHIRDLVNRAQLPMRAPRIGAARALQLIRMDKKVQHGSIRLVLLDKLGGAVVTSAYEPSALDALLAEHFA